jgi:hypothetical protein
MRCATSMAISPVSRGRVPPMRAAVHWIRPAASDGWQSATLSSALYTGLQAARTVIAADHGDSAAVARYVAHVRDIHRVYREQLCAFYAMEQRWPDAAFWAARLAPFRVTPDHTVDV